MAGVTNLDVAAASLTAMNGYRVSTLREGDEQIPIVARMQMEERAQLGDIQNLYVFSSQGTQKVPLRILSTHRLRPRRPRRCSAGTSSAPSPCRRSRPRACSPSEVLMPAMAQHRGVRQHAAPGYTLEIGGEYEKQMEGFGELAVVMLHLGGHDLHRARAPVQARDQAAASCSRPSPTASWARCSRCG